MSTIKHQLITNTYYSVVLNSSNRMMPEKLNEFFDGFDFDALGDSWHDNHLALRGYEGDFEGIEIYYDEGVEKVFEHIAKKLDVDVASLGQTSIKITCI